jgi:YidC/Oxa1 family membrane protein insertase
MWQVYTFPTPGSPAAEEKEVRDHEHENVRRKRTGQISLEEEELVKAKEAAEQRENQGFQRQQPKRKGHKK